jgi:hypothetical protein
MTSDLIGETLTALMNNNFTLSYHARVRMEERNVLRIDIVSVGETAVGSYIQANGTVRVPGLDDSGNPLTVIAAYEDGILIVTVFGD